MDRRLAAATAVGLAGADAVRAFRPRRVPEPRRALRELDGADFGDHGGAARHSWGARCGDDAWSAKRRLLPGRSADHDRAVLEERHPDRRVRARPRSAGQVGDRSRGRSRAFAVAADPDDVARIRSWRVAPGHCQRGRVGQRERGRPRGYRWHVDRHVPCPVPDPDVLLRDYRKGVQEEGPLRGGNVGDARARIDWRDEMKTDASVNRVSDKSARHRGVALVTIAALLAGCSLQPVYERPAAPVAATYPTGDAYKSSIGGSGSTLPAVDTGWRDFLTDPRLQRLVEIALPNNLDLRVAALNVAQMQAQYRIQRAAMFPQVSAFAASSATRTPASLSTTRNATVTHDYQVGVSAAWEIDFFGRLQSLNDQALQQYFATAQARKAAQLLLVSEIADQYLTLLAYDDLLAVTQRTLETAQASYKLTLLQFQAGTGSELSVRQAETVVEQAKANYSAQLRGRAQAENALVLLLGQPLPAALPPPAPLNVQTILADRPAGPRRDAL